MQIYHFSEITGELLGVGEADPDPLEPDNWLIPANATDIAPPGPVEGNARVFAGGVWGYVRIDGGEQTPQPEPVAPTIDDYAAAVQSAVDAIAKSMLFNDGVTLASYVSSTNPAWQSQAVAFVAWRDQVWAYSYSQLADVQSGARPQPSIIDFLGELPPMVWPE